MRVGEFRWGPRPSRGDWRPTYVGRHDPAWRWFRAAYRIPKHTPVRVYYHPGWRPPVYRFSPAGVRGRAVLIAASVPPAWVYGFPSSGLTH